MSGSEPRLHKYTIDDLNDEQILDRVLTEHLPGSLMEVTSGGKAVQAQIRFCSLNRIHLFYGHWGCTIQLRTPHTTYFMQDFPIHGSCETVSCGTAMISSPSKGPLVQPGPVAFSPTLGYEHLVTLMDPEALLKIASALAGASPVGQLKLEPSNFEALPEARLSRRLVGLLVDELDAGESIPSPVVLAELEQAILVAFLCGHKHNFSALLGRQPAGAAPWQVRRVEEYIEANWDQPISIEALAVVANASARSIFHSFKEHRRYSPMSFVKNVRLKHAREMLSSRAHEMSVTSVAFACGFGNLGHFASDYRRAFGEMPSATLIHARCGVRR